MGDRRVPLFTALRDSVGEGLINATSRGRRSWLVAGGIATGIASLVAVLGVTETSTGHLLREIDSLSPTLVTVEAVSRGTEPVVITWEVERQLARLDGVVAVGGVGRSQREVEVTGAPGFVQSDGAAGSASVFVATSGVLDALQLSIASGRPFSAVHDVTPMPVVILGPVAARGLGVGDVDGHRSVLIDGAPHVVLGVLASAGSGGAFTDAVLLPSAQAAEFGVAGPHTVYVRVRPGAADPLSEQLPAALHPGSPSDVRAFTVRPSSEVRGIVESETDRMLVVLAGIVTVLATLTASAVMLSAVLERRAEIGLRRAIGATRRRIVGEYLVQSIWLGAVGGIGGTAIGVLITGAVAVARDVPPLIPAAVVIVAPIVGVAAGLVAGALPAARAARVHPANALRTG